MKPIIPLAALLVAAPALAVPPPPAPSPRAFDAQAATPASPDAPAHDASPVSLRDEETVVFYGDSITEQNLYSAYLETFFLSRFPGKRIMVVICKDSKDKTDMIQLIN